MKFIGIRIAFWGALILQLSGCEYRLTAPVPLARQLILIDARNPEQYKLQMNAEDARTFDVPPDGRLTLDVPPYRRSCGPYLFGVMNVGRGGDPLKNWTVSITRGGKTVRRLSLRSLLRLATDGAGYHIVKIG